MRFSKVGSSYNSCPSEQGWKTSEESAAALAGLGELLLSFRDLGVRVRISVVQSAVSPLALLIFRDGIQ